MIIYRSTVVRPYVYMGTHKTTGHIYIGYREANTVPSDIDLFIYRTSSKIVRPNFDDYDWHVVAEFFAGDDAYDFEQQLIYENWGNSLLLNGYYCKPNGSKRFKKNVCLEETKLKISAKNKGKKRTAEQNRVTSIIGKGKVRSEETKQKMRKPKSLEHANKNRIANKGKKQSIEVRAARVEMLRNRSTEEKENTSKKMSLARKGIATVYDLHLLQVVKIPKSLFAELKNIRYVGLNSKLRAK